MFGASIRLGDARYAARHLGQTQHSLGQAVGKNIERVRATKTGRGHIEVRDANTPTPIFDAQARLLAEPGHRGAVGVAVAVIGDLRHIQWLDLQARRGALGEDAIDRARRPADHPDRSVVRSGTAAGEHIRRVGSVRGDRGVVVGRQAGECGRVGQRIAVEHLLRHGLGHAFKESIVLFIAELVLVIGHLKQFAIDGGLRFQQATVDAALRGGRLARLNTRVQVAPRAGGDAGAHGENVAGVGVAFLPDQIVIDLIGLREKFGHIRCVTVRVGAAGQIDQGKLGASRHVSKLHLAARRVTALCRGNIGLGGNAGAGGAAFTITLTDGCQKVDHRRMVTRAGEGQDIPQFRTGLFVRYCAPDCRFGIIQDGVAAVARLLVELLAPVAARAFERIDLLLSHLLMRLLDQLGAVIHDFLASLLWQAEFADQAVVCLDLLRGHCDALRDCPILVDRQGGGLGIGGHLSLSPFRAGFMRSSIRALND